MLGHRVKLVYRDELVKRPVIYELAKDFDVSANIRRASVEDGTGWIVCELVGDQDKIESALTWLASIGVEVDRLSDIVES
ncbi:MAG: FeS-binding protein [Acidimicrobiaceae bacterium]|nr:FeS-binding protein [Acidimicrobiaceae bacterium]